MKTQPEALRLADELDAYHTRSCHKEAAAELRRLHAENERLKTVPMKYQRMEFNAQLQAENERLIAQRDALLEALKEIVDAADGTGWDQLDASFSKARAAIKAAEETK